MGEQPGAPAGASAHVEHPMSGTDLEQPQHGCHGAGLGVRLAVTNRQRPVLGSPTALAPRQETLARHGGEGVVDGIHPHQPATRPPAAGRGRALSMSVSRATLNCRSASGTIWAIGPAAT